MYIVNEGLVWVVGGVNKSVVLAELGPGSIFGEIRLEKKYTHTINSIVIQCIQQCNWNGSRKFSTPTVVIMSSCPFYCSSPFY